MDSPTTATTAQPPAQHQQKQKKLQFKMGRSDRRGFRRNEGEPVGWEVFTPVPPALHEKRANFISTTKYSVLTFIPLFLYSQFRRFYNIYFLLGALSALYPSSALSPMSQISPLLAVLLFAALKDLIEDYARYRSDCEANEKITQVVRDGVLLEVKAQDLMKGDLVFVKKNEKLSVDAIIMASSLEDGTCFVETAELDGETNLKRRSAIPALTHYQAFEDIIRVNLHVQCEQPNENLLSFEGRAKYVVSSGAALPDRRRSFFEPHKHDTEAARASNHVVDGPGVAPLSMTNLILRGSVLRNTESAWVSVVYTGADTKIIRNLKKPPGKESRMMKWLNLLVMGIFIYNAVILFVSCGLEYAQYVGVYQTPSWWYLPKGNTDSLATNFLGALFSYFGMYTYVIPISLFVMVEMDRLVQGLLMVWDTKMTLLRPPPPDAPPGAEAELVPMRANNTNLNEDLAAVEYIFSDKTGTLTQNEMRLSQWYLNGIIYDDMKHPGSFGDALRSDTISDEMRNRMTLFYRTMVLCHGVIPSISEISGRLIYESQSPDETALVEAIANSKIVLTGRSKSKVTFTLPDAKGQPQPQVYEVLHSLEFNSDRKRMSVILKEPETGRYHLYCKGADNIILERLSRDLRMNPTAEIDAAVDALHKFSVVGLRTLCIAHRELDDDLYHDFKDAYEAAETSLEDRDLKMTAACEKVEHDLTLVGCTAIEDRLQDEVPETIDFLLRCGIKLWLLTGDKQETAINIGQSSKLIQPGMMVMKLNSKTVLECGAALDDILRQMEENKALATNGYTLVVDGLSLGHVFSGNFQEKMLAVGVQCHSVICCRVTPLQKSQVVNMVKDGLKKMTLAIGDGANDVSMIMSAHVGVGIMGREGTQAVRSSDFAFAEFRFLKRLLVVHGRWSYMRLSNLIFYSFYKNLAFITIQFWFGFYSLWCGQLIYEEFFMTWFNVFFTALPPLFLGVFEQDVSDANLEACPQLFYQSRAGQYWNWKLFVGVILDAIWHSLAVFFGIYMTVADGVLDTQGRAIGYWVNTFFFGNLVVLVVFAKLSMVTYHWVWPTWFVLLLSLAVTCIAAIVIEAIGYGSVIGTYSEAYSLPAFWLALPLIVAACVIPTLAWMYGRRTLAPYDSDIIIEKTQEKRKLKITAGPDIELAAVEQ
ncbi:hypothetical protein BC830DRAFT_1136639 [Chytriomyces sp. MP71]|nr:hypothetical protein BC830DRAFT_1136639 [Chytriomyces sp. MP71]